MSNQLHEYLFKFESSYTALNLVLEAVRNRALSKEENDEIWAMTENERNERMILVLSGLHPIQIIKLYEKVLESLMDTVVQNLSFNEEYY